MRNILYFAAALAFAGAVVTGCSSSSSTTIVEDSGPPKGDSATDAKSDHSTTPPGDSGKDVSTITPDGGDATTPPPTPDGGLPDGTATNPDSGTCVYSAFVINLINTQTNGTALPSANLGQNCVQDQDAAAYSSLF